MIKAQPWKPSDATDEIRRIASNPHLSITYKIHAKDRMKERSLVISDVLYALKNGFVYDDAVPATRPNHYKYRMECRTPNSGNRAIGLIVIPAESFLKIITVMWIDEF